MNNLYRVLGLKRDTTPEQISKAYRRLALRFHPDRNPGDAKAAARFGAVQQAHDVLSDPARRRHYDETGEVVTAARAAAPALAVLAAFIPNVFGRMVGAGLDPATFDVVAQLRRDVQAEKDKLVKGVRQAEKIKRIVEGTAARLPPGHPLTAVVEEQLARIAADVDAAERSAAAMDATLALLKDCPYRLDRAGVDDRPGGEVGRAVRRVRRGVG